jgi:hypothetical protein
MDRGNGDGSTNDLPWASVFDPAANARALSAIQAEGFRAASELVDRFARIATTGIGGSDRPGTPAAPLSNDQRADFFGATDIEPLIRSWWSLVGQMLLGSNPPVTDSRAPVNPATLDLSSDEATGQLVLKAAASAAATAVVWLHNRGVKDFGQVRLRCSDLLADDGRVVDSDAVTFGPAVVPMPARSSRGIDMTIKVAADVGPGVYRGTLLAEGHQDLWLPVVLTVRSAAT